jgi:hypothetical protein
MLFPVSFVDTNLNFLNDVLRQFIQKSIVLTNYTKASLFPAEFIPIHDHGRNAIDTKFRNVFEEIKNLTPAEKKRLLRLYINHQRVKKLCEKKTLPKLELSSFPNSLQISLKELGEYLYTSGLKNAAIRKLANGGAEEGIDSLLLHSQRYRAENGTVCCFCGINDYEEQLADTVDSKQWRPAYDHYLPKDKYPLAAVNFNNLFPVCYQCNSKSKGAEDPCYCKIDSQRKLSFYPFNSSAKGGLFFSYSSSEAAILSNEFWEVELDDDSDENQLSWDRVFGITKRVKDRLNRKYKKWLQSVLAGDNSSMDDLKIKLQEASIFNMVEKRNIRDGYHKSLTFGRLASMQDELLESIVNALNDEIVPDTRVEALEALNELGFEFS